MDEKSLEKQRIYRARKRKDPDFVEKEKKKYKLYDLKRDKSKRREQARARYSKKSLDFLEKEKLRIASFYQTPKGRHSALKRKLKADNVSDTDPLWNLSFYREFLLWNECHYCLGPLNLSGHNL